VYVGNNIQGSDLNKKEASILVFGSILEGPDKNKLTPLVTSAIPTLCNLLKDNSKSLRDTTCWTIGKMCEIHGDAIKDQLALVINSLLDRLDDGNEIVNHACFALSQIAELGGSDQHNNCLNA